MTIVVRTNLAFEGLLQQRRAAGRNVTLGALTLLVAGAAAFWGVTEWELSRLRVEIAETKAEETNIERDLGPKRARAELRAEQVARRDAVLHLARKRWNWAPVLERLFAAVPANTELSSLRIKDSDERIVELAGRSAGTQSRMEADKCRRLLAAALTEAGYDVAAKYAKLDDSDKVIRFDATDNPVAEFVIELKLK